MRKFNWIPPTVHPSSYGSLQVTRNIGDKLYIVLPGNNYVCVELLETGKTRGLVQVTAHRSMPIIRGESIAPPHHLNVNDWGPEEEQSSLEDTCNDFRD